MRENKFEKSHIHI